MDKNVCHFIPYHKDYHAIHTVNFVLETKPQVGMPLHTEALYKMHICVSGAGVLHTKGKSEPIDTGDVFFTFPGTAYAIASQEDFTYMYISFLGARGHRILDMLGITPYRCVFHDCRAVFPFWQEGMQAKAELLDLISESILLYTFTYLGNRLLTAPDNRAQGEDIILWIKKYVDENFSQAELSLETISHALGYNKKYISYVFKKHMDIGVVEYLNTLRIQNACTMIQQGGTTSVSDVAYACGFRDPQYFSKVFKHRMGVSPATYIQEETKRKKGL